MLLLFLLLLCVLAFCLFYAAVSGDMWEAVIMLYELGSCLLPWLLALAVALCRRRREAQLGEQESVNWLWMALFGLYITLALQVTGSGTLYDALFHGVQISGGEVNLYPFSQGIDPIGYVLNVVLGMPLGFLLPLLWPRMNRPGKVICAGAAFSLLIELSQLCNFRATDVDDLLMNTLGTWLGFLLFRLFLHVGDRDRERQLEQMHWPLGPAVTVAILFLGRFFLFCGPRVIWMLYR